LACLEPQEILLCASVCREWYAWLLEIIQRHCGMYYHVAWAPRLQKDLLRVYDDSLQPLRQWLTVCRTKKRMMEIFKDINSQQPHNGPKWSLENHSMPFVQIQYQSIWNDAFYLIWNESLNYSVSGRKPIQTDTLTDECDICNTENENDLVLCDSCPKMFHLTCLGLKSLPEGNYFCQSCRNRSGTYTIKESYFSANYIRPSRAEVTDTAYHSGQEDYQSSSSEEVDIDEVEQYVDPPDEPEDEELDDFDSDEVDRGSTEEMEHRDSDEGEWLPEPKQKPMNELHPYATGGHHSGHGPTGYGQPGMVPPGYNLGGSQSGYPPRSYNQPLGGLGGGGHTSAYPSMSTAGMQGLSGGLSGGSSLMNRGGYPQPSYPQSSTSSHASFPSQSGLSSGGLSSGLSSGGLQGGLSGSFGGHSLPSFSSQSSSQPNFNQSGSQSNFNPSQPSFSPAPGSVGGSNFGGSGNTGGGGSNFSGSSAPNFSGSGNTGGGGLSGSFSGQSLGQSFESQPQSLLRQSLEQPLPQHPLSSPPTRHSLGGSHNSLPPMNNSLPSMSLGGSTGGSLPSMSSSMGMNTSNPMINPMSHTSTPMTHGPMSHTSNAMTHHSSGSGGGANQQQSFFGGGGGGSNQDSHQSLPSHLSLPSSHQSLYPSSGGGGSQQQLERVQQQSYGGGGTGDSQQSHPSQSLYMNPSSYQNSGSLFQNNDQSHSSHQSLSSHQQQSHHPHQQPLSRHQSSGHPSSALTNSGSQYSDYPTSTSGSYGGQPSYGRFPSLELPPASMNQNHLGSSGSYPSQQGWMKQPNLISPGMGGHYLRTQPSSLSQQDHNSYPYATRRMMTRGQSAKAHRSRENKAACFTFSREGKQTALKKFDQSHIAEVLWVSYGVPLSEQELLVVDSSPNAKPATNTPKLKVPFELIFRFWNSQYGRLCYFPRAPFDHDCGALWLGKTLESVAYADVGDALIPSATCISAHPPARVPQTQPATTPQPTKLESVDDFLS